MVGMIVVTHGNIGVELVKAVKHILPESTSFRAVAVTANEAPQIICHNIRKALDELPCTHGALLLTDLFGGTPCNACLTFIKKDEVEVIAGVNLPMLVKLAYLQQDKKNLSELIHFVQEYGKKSIVIASEVLEVK